MRILNLYLLLFLFATLPVNGQTDKQAKNVLDKTSAAFTQAKGIKAVFSIRNTSKNGDNAGSGEGTILLKGERFFLETEGTLTWFDGKTQWSYLTSSEEVNISNPTPEELQTINPYALLDMYRFGYNYKYNGIKAKKGKQGYEVVLTPLDKKQDVRSITLFVSKSYQPLSIVIEQKDKAKSEITVMSYQTNQTLSDNTFRFDRTKYPEAEIIDLR